ncbi:MAG: MerR family transcriptional regulator, partial [Alphaproteobacteria bacterium]|nr:MerR family transcriptional regulator [Alphaproteobacteria bacterium]
MCYSVKQLTTLSGVSVRTLHWYDQIGLLKPDFYGSNGYRYYAEKDLLLLQQILFFKELGFPLKEIQKLLTMDGFDQIKALQAHKVFLKNEIERKNKLLETIDKTILYLKGTEKMTDKELYYGFDSDRQKEYEQYIVKCIGSDAEKLLAESHKRTAKWDKDEW